MHTVIIGRTSVYVHVMNHAYFMLILVHELNFNHRFEFVQLLFMVEYALEILFQPSYYLVLVVYVYSTVFQIKIFSTQLKEKWQDK